MAGLLYTYSVTSIRAAKRNAQLHREADGGQLDMRRESLRRHGALEKVPQTSGLDLFRDVRGGRTEEARKAKEETERSMGQSDVGQGKGVWREGNRGPRTGVEGSLEGYKGRGKALERFKEEIPEMPED